MDKHPTAMRESAETGSAPRADSVPQLCKSCKKYEDPAEEVMCNLIRIDQEGKGPFTCPSHEPEK